MKKQLLLIRHAKSRWDETDIRDHERALAQRGRKDIDIMRKAHKLLFDNTDTAFTSTANRAASTAKGLFLNTIIESKNDLYTFDYGELHASLLQLLKAVHEKTKQVALVAHNPAITKLISVFSGDNLVNLPTCGMAVIQFKQTTWQSLATSHGKLLFFSVPKYWRSNSQH